VYDRPIVPREDQRDAKRLEDSINRLRIPDRKVTSMAVSPPDEKDKQDIFAKISETCDKRRF